MLWRERKVLRDRAAGMVFDWRSGHGSSRRLFFAFIVALSFGGALFAYVRIREPEPTHFRHDQIDLTLVDLSSEQNRWLAEIIDRETLFHRRWDVADPSILESVVAASLAARSPRSYQATLRELSPPAPEVALTNLPGMGPEVLPPPEPFESVVAANPPVNWWVEVQVVDGPAGVQPFSFPWPAADDARELSEGEIWTVLLAVDWQGKLVVHEPISESVNARTSVILARCRKLKFPAVAPETPLRWWKLEARVVNSLRPE